MPHSIQGSRRWLALIVLCLGVVMIILDSTIVNVALPSIQADLGFSQISLVWVVNAYLLTFGGFLLLGGRLGDFYGARRVFLIGIVAFTLASLGCGLATSQAALIWARAVQGLGGAVVDSVSLALIMDMFTEPGERAKAMGVYGFVCSAGGCIGVLLGGVLTTSLDWHWIFLVNLPIGVLVYVLCLWLVPVAGTATGGQHGTKSLDVLGALTVTAASMLGVYAVINGSEAGWISKQSIGLISAAAVLMVLFLVIESRVRSPLVPLGVFRSRVVATANIAAVLWAAASFAWFFVGTLYLQRVLGQNPMRVGLAFLPADLVMAILSLGLSAKLVMRFGIKIPLVAGMLIGALGLALFAVAPVNGEVLTDVLPGMILLGLGAAVAFNPLLLSAMGGLPASDSGLAAGLINTSSMMGGALGLAILASAAAAWTSKLSGSGAVPLDALNGGYHVAFALGAACAVAAAVLCAVMLPAGSADKLSARESTGSAL